MNRPAEELIDKVLNGLASEDEAKSIAEWFATEDGQDYLSSKLDTEFINLKKGYEDIMVGHDIPSEKIYETILRHIQRRRIKSIIFKAAAILLPLIFITGILFHLDSKVDLFGYTEYEEVYVPKAERAQFIFQDGTKAFINSDSRIRYPKKFGLNDRTIYLSGEAYFEVKPNKNRPFVVEIEKGKIQVLGTSFNVEAYAENKNAKITLDEGKINLISWTKQNHYLNPGEKVIYNKETGECTSVEDSNTRIVSLWRKDIIAFSDTPLSEVINRLNKWYDVDFIVEDRKALQYSYTFTSENTLLENVLRDMEKVAPVKFVYEDKTVKIRIK